MNSASYAYSMCFYFYSSYKILINIMISSYSERIKIDMVYMYIKKYRYLLIECLSGVVVSCLSSQKNIWGSNPWRRGGDNLELPSQTL